MANFINYIPTTVGSNNNGYYNSPQTSNDPYIQEILNTLDKNSSSNGLNNYHNTYGDSNPTKNNIIINNDNYEKYFNTFNKSK